MGRPTRHQRLFSLPRTRHVLALAALVALSLPVQLGPAAAQPAPDGCLQDPASCLPAVPPPPQLPPVDGCLADPASCLPDAPETDPCLQDPSGCVPDTPEVDPCLQDPASCLPDTPEADSCVEAPRSCLPAAGEQESGGRQNDNDGHDGDDQGAIAPGKRGGGPRGEGDAGSRGGDRRGATSRVRDAEIHPATPALADSPVAAEVASAPGILERIEGGIQDAARRFAFPMALAGLVGTFLLVQGRVDRKDPKLVAAPIDSRDDVVNFD